MLLTLAVAVLGFVGQPSQASDATTATECATIASHLGPSVHMGASEMDGGASKVHASHLPACPFLGCISISLGEGNPLTPLVSIETAVTWSLDRADHSGLAVSPGYRPPIAI
ncbi:hypothetical protein [Tabrizicola soli]|uniref:DUF2946 domain-containing protein n=1 Tax=Tabrizicola soli TaxID=2185115 RepID=A0ABV7DR20_9RHOB|nr:hypothetical protein [Tabrizicola soli]